MTAAVELTGVTAGYGGKIVLRDLTCTIEPGELVGIVGPSGSGKTTLLRLLTGGATLLGGTVRVHGEGVTRQRRVRRVGFVPQLGTGDASVPLTVEQVVLFGLTAESRRVPWFSAAEKARARRLLDRLGLSDHARRRIDELSGGQQQRMFLARAMVRDADLILLDEPTSGVDLAARREVLGLLGSLNDDGVTVVLTTHDLNWVAAQLPRVVCLHGTVVADGTPAAVFTPDVLRTTFGADARVTRDGDTLLIADASPVFAERSGATP
jgi:zinc/manganese transport system ATP-binding protein